MQLTLSAGVFPTHVGVFLIIVTIARRQISLPHARGGVSAAFHLKVIRVLSSPRTWGCFCERLFFAAGYFVFPTHVGVFLGIRSRAKDFGSLPHARGGVSFLRLRLWRCGGSSPRTWGCFLMRFFVNAQKGVFPTHVGVFPLQALRLGHLRSLPHARGGVSGGVFFHVAGDWSSPRTWGCFSTRPWYA